MNKKRLQRFNLLVYMFDNLDVNNKNKIDYLKIMFEELLEEEQEAYDNIPENLLNSSKCMESEEYMDEIQGYIDDLDKLLT